MEEKVLTIKGNKLLLKEADERDKLDILNFLNFLFQHKNYDEKWFGWVRDQEYYKRNYYIAINEYNKIIGIYGLSPVKFKIKENFFWGSHSCNVGIHPDFWGSNLFLELSLFSFQNDREKGRAFAFCSPRRALAIRAHKKIGWKELGLLSFFEKKKINKFDVKKFRVFDKFDKKLGDIQNKFFKNFDFCVLKDSNYINWRYEGKSYEFFTDFESSFFILKKYEKRVHIIELFFKEEKGLKEIIDFSLKNLEESFILNTWAFKGSWLEMALKKLDFIENGEVCPLLIYPYEEKIFEEMKSCDNIYFALGDDEAF